MSNQISKDKDALLWACQNGYDKIVEFILSNQQFDTAFINKAFREACKYGHIDTVRLLLADSRVNPVAQCNYAIRLACLSGHSEVVKLLLKYPQVNPGDSHNMSIYWASENGYIDVVRLLLDDPRVNPNGGDGIKIKNNVNDEYAEIVIIDNVLCHVKNGNVKSIKDKKIREKFIKWQSQK